MSEIIDSLEFSFQQTQQESYKMSVQTFKNGNMRVVFTNSANTEKAVFNLSHIIVRYGANRFYITSSRAKKNHEGFRSHFESFLKRWPYYYKPSNPVLRYGS